MQARNRPAQNTPIWIGRSCVRSESASVHAITPSAAASIARKMSRLYQPRAVEAEDEGQQIERQRHDPQQRHRRDVLRDVVGHREQQHRARRGERAPEDLARRASAARSIAPEATACEGDASCARAPPTSGHLQARRTRRPRRARRRARSRPTIPTPACGWRPRARAGTDSRGARAATRGSTARTGDRGCGPGSAAQTTPAPAGSSSTAGNTAGRSCRRAGPGSATTGFSVPAGFQNAPGMIGSATRLTTSSATCSLTCVRAARAGAPRNRRTRSPSSSVVWKKTRQRRPDRRRAAEPGQDLLRDDGLHQEQQERASEDRQGKERHRGEEGA